MDLRQGNRAPYAGLMAHGVPSQGQLMGRAPYLVYMDLLQDPLICCLEERIASRRQACAEQPVQGPLTNSVLPVGCLVAGVA